jgi:hypothetical protein
MATENLLLDYQPTSPNSALLYAWGHYLAAKASNFHLHQGVISGSI